LERTRWLFNSIKDCCTLSFDTPTNLPIKIMKGKSTFVTTPLNLCEKRISFLHIIVKIRSNPPATIKKTNRASPMVKKRGRRG
jgi:hypothetical protein